MTFVVRFFNRKLTRYFRHFPVERGIARKAEDVVRAVVVAPVHRLNATIVAVASPDDASVPPRLGASQVWFALRSILHEYAQLALLILGFFLSPSSSARR